MKRQVVRIADTLLSRYPARIVGDLFWKLEKRRLRGTGFFEAEHIFVVGCGHSGTSVLLSRIDNHSAVMAIPGESRFFQLDPLRRSIQLRKWSAHWKPGYALAEKTPAHIRYCEEIKSTFRNSHIVAICRHPLDTVASLYLRNGENLQKAVDRWNRNNELVLKESQKGTVGVVVKYEEFVRSPERLLREVQAACQLKIENGLGLNSDEKENWYSSKVTVVRREHHKEGHSERRQNQINQPIFDGRGKYTTVLTSEQVQNVLTQTRHVSIQLGYSETP